MMPCGERLMGKGLLQKPPPCTFSKLRGNFGILNATPNLHHKLGIRTELQLLNAGPTHLRGCFPNAIPQLSPSFSQGQNQELPISDCTAECGLQYSHFHQPRRFYHNNYTMDQISQSMMNQVKTRADVTSKVYFH